MATGEEKVDHLDWEEYFMGMAAVASMRSKALYKHEVFGSLLIDTLTQSKQRKQLPIICEKFNFSRALCERINKELSKDLLWEDGKCRSPTVVPTRHGAVIVNKDNKIVGVGYNGMPLNIPDIGRMEVQDQKDLMCDEHTNAVLFRSIADLSGCDMYATRFPERGGAKVLIQSKINNLFYMSKGKRDENDIDDMLVEGKVEAIQYLPGRRKIEIDFKSFGEIEPDYKQMDIKRLISVIQKKLMKNNFEGFTKMSKNFQLMDTSKCGFLDADNIRKLCYALHVPMTQNMLRALLIKMAPKDQGHIDYEGFIKHLNWKDSLAMMSAQGTS